MKAFYFFVLINLFACTSKQSDTVSTELNLLEGSGLKVFQTHCVSCHQLNGEGTPGLYPPLNQSEYVLGEKGRLIRIALHGLVGEIEIQGITYSGAMPPWKHLSNESLGAVLTFIRKSWQNDASPVSSDEIEAVREFTKDRKTPWTYEELKQSIHRAIPHLATIY